MYSESVSGSKIKFDKMHGHTGTLGETFYVTQIFKWKQIYCMFPIDYLKLRWTLHFI